MFYGVNHIDDKEYKIKIKLGRNGYFLYAKNSYIKLMVEMDYQGYMKMHVGFLRGNPCNILKHLKIEGEELIFSGCGK